MDTVEALEDTVEDVARRVHGAVRMGKYEGATFDVRMLKVPKRSGERYDFDNL